MTLGGEDAALERLMQSAAAVVPLSLMLAALAASFHLAVASPSPDHLLRRMTEGTPWVLFALNGAAWWSWWSAVRQPPFAARASIPRLAKVSLAAWWICAGAAAALLLFPDAFGDAPSRPLVVALAIAAILPWCLVEFTSTQTPEKQFRVWRRHLIPTRTLSASLGGLIVLAVLTMTLGAFLTVKRVFGSIEVFVQVAWLYSTIAALAALATAQLIVLVGAAAGARSAAWRARLRRNVRRRAWAGAIGLPVVLTGGVICSIAVSLRRMTLWLGHVESPPTLINSHFSAVRHLADRVGESAESGVIFFGALAGVATIWIGATFLPLLVIGRDDIRA